MAVSSSAATTGRLSQSVASGPGTDTGRVPRASGPRPAPLRSGPTWWACLSIIVFVFSGCTGAGSEGTTTTSSSSPTTSRPVTTTTAPPSPGEALVEVLDDPLFSATVEFEGSQTTPDGEIPLLGGGAISGDDSEGWKVSDLSSLTTTHLQPTTGLFVGIGGLKSISEAVKVVDGVAYEQLNGGPWHMVDRPPAANVSDLFEALAALDEFQFVDTRVVRGEVLSVLRPVGELTLAPKYVGADSSTIHVIETDSVVLVDAGGAPTQVELTIEYDSAPAAGVVVETLTFRISDVGSPRVIEKPAVVMTSLAARGFELIPDAGPLVDLQFPESWDIVDQGPGYVTLVTDELVELSVSGFTVPEGFDIDDVTEDLLTQLGFVADTIEDLELGVYPGRLARALTVDDGFRMVYAEVRSGALGVLLQWVGPPFGDDLQQRHFERLLTTLQWLGGAEATNVVPGDTLGEALLQQDTLQLIEAFAAGLGCETAEVIWTTPIVGYPSGWSEDWYVSACPAIDVYRVDYDLSPGGGTDILIAEPNRGGDADRWIVESGVAMDVLANLLRSQPSILEVGADAHPLLVASAAARARLRDINLHVWILAEDPDDPEADLAGQLLDELGLGTVLVVSPGWVWWGSEDDGLTLKEIDRAGNRSLDGRTNDEVVDIFVNRLLDND